MSEPVYNYVRGQGWVPSVVSHDIVAKFEDARGKWWGIVMRGMNPQAGDVWDACMYEKDLNWWLARWNGRVPDRSEVCRWKPENSIIYKQYIAIVPCDPF